MAQNKLVRGGRPPKALLEPVKGPDGIYRLDRIRHRAFNGEYPRSSGSGRTRKECLEDWEEAFERNRRKNSVLDDELDHDFALTDPMLLAFEKVLELTQRRVRLRKISQQTYGMYKRAIYLSKGKRANPNAIRLGPQLGHLSIGEAAKPALLNRYLVKVADQVPGVAQRHHVVLSATFEMLTLAGLFDVSPMAPVPKPELQKPKPAALKRDARVQLYGQICQRVKRARYFRVLYLTILGTGIRPGEAFALWWEDLFDLDDPTIAKAVMRVAVTAVRLDEGTVRQNNRKSKEEGECYYIMLPVWLTTALREWKAYCKPESEQTPVFLSSWGTEITASAADANLVKARKDSDVDWVTWGNLRDTVATHVKGKTGDARNASAQLGHAEGASVAVRFYIDRDGYQQPVVDNSDALEDLDPVKDGAKLESGRR